MLYDNIFFLSIIYRMDFKKIEVYCPKQILDKKRKHKNDDEWVNFYYYIDKIRYNVPRVEITSKQPYRKNTFYKCSIESDKDDVWDYYKVLKKGITKKDIGMKNKLKSKKKSNFVCNHKIKFTRSNNPLILHFD